MMKDSSALSPTSADLTAQEREPRADDKSVQEWAAILAATGLVPRTEAVRLAIPEDPAASWRGRDGDLTQGEQKVNGRAPSETRESSSTRVELKVDAADLGELAVA